MKVVLFSSYVYGNTVGGVEIHILYLARSLARLGVNVIIVRPVLAREDGILEEEKYGIKIASIFVRSRIKRVFSFMERYHGAGVGLLLALLSKMKFNLYYRRIYKAVVKYSPDLVHQHDYLASLLLSKKLAKRIPVIWTNHLGEYLYLDRYALTRLIQARLIMHNTRIIGPSHELVPATSGSIYIPNGVDTAYFCPASRTQKVRMQQQVGVLGKVVFLCPRRWAPTKGVVFLARAIKSLGADVLDRCIFLFTGSDSDGFSKYGKEVRTLLEVFTPNHVRLLGNVEHQELLRYYQIADVVVVPSLMEATSLAALEAMACGVPVLGTNVGGMPEVVTDGWNGWLVTPAAPSSLAEAITRIAANSDDIVTKGKRAREAVESHFSWEVVAKRTHDVYKEAVSCSAAVYRR